MPLRVGFVSTANIGKKNIMAIRKAKDVAVIAVSSRSKEKASEWATTWDVPKAYGSHEELFADPDVDAVYIPLPTGVRSSVVIAAAKAGKHVLCEKPIAPSTDEALSMIEACQNNNVVFMDGVMFMHNPRLEKIKEVLKSIDFGQVTSVCSEFSFNGDDEFKQNNIRGDRLAATLEPLGSLGDLGWYNVRFALFAFDWVLPESVTAVAQTLREGVPVHISAILTFGEGKSSIFTNSFEAAFRQSASIVGTKQTVELDDFVISGPDSNLCTFRVATRGLTEFDLLPKTTIVEHKVDHNVNQEVIMWEKFAELCSTRDTDQINFYSEVAIKTQKIMDAIMASVAKNGMTVPLSAKRGVDEM